MTDLPRHVADTHTILWHLERHPRLSPVARQLLLDAEEGMGWIYVSAISLVEVIYLFDRGRLDAALVDKTLDLLSVPSGSFSTVAVNLDIVNALRRVPRDLVPDMPDRIITATAFARGLPLITADGRIHAAGVVPVVW